MQSWKSLSALILITNLSGCSQLKFKQHPNATGWEKEGDGREYCSKLVQFGDNKSFWLHKWGYFALAPTVILPMASPSLDDKPISLGFNVVALLTGGIGVFLLNRSDAATDLHTESTDVISDTTISDRAKYRLCSEADINWSQKKKTGVRIPGIK
jgi:hypothetical protein